MKAVKKKGSAAKAAKRPAKKAAAKKAAARKAAPAKAAKKSAARKAPARKAPAKAAVAKKAVAKKPVAKKPLAKPAAREAAKPVAKPAPKAPAKAAQPSPPPKAPAAAARPAAPAASASAHAAPPPKPAPPSPPIKSFVSVSSHNGGAKGSVKSMSSSKSAVVRRGKETQRIGEAREHAPVDGNAFKSDFLKRQRAKLQTKKEEILAMYRRDLQSGQESNDSPTEDIVDRANNAYSRELAFSISDNERELMLQIDQAIGRLDAGTYGYCLHTGMPIGIARLEAIPWAKYGVEAQEMLEKGLLSEA